MPIRYILDTCTLSHFLEGRERVVQRVGELPVQNTFVTLRLASAPLRVTSQIADATEVNVEKLECLS